VKGYELKCICRCWAPLRHRRPRAAGNSSPTNVSDLRERLLGEHTDAAL
jgi:hypothetical protein